LVLYWLPLIAWMTLIFSASSDQQSFEHSSRLLGPLLHWLFPSITPETEDEWIFVCRKVAHFLEYALLGVLAWRLLRSLKTSSSVWTRQPLLMSLAIVFLYAVSDEVHQAFVPTRQAAVVDAFIDTCGGAAGLAMVWVIQRLVSRRLQASLAKAP
jgi:VanZ family protein